MLATTVLAVTLAVAWLPAAASESAAADADSNREFATEVLGDPWDFENAEDALLAHGPPVSMHVSNAGFDAGTYRWTSDGGFVDLHPMTVPGALPDSRDGRWNPVDADTYTHLSMRLWASQDQAFRIGWFVCTNEYSGCDRFHDFWVQSGWHTYTVPLRQVSGDWRGMLQGLRLASGGGATTFRLDWLRIHTAEASPTPPEGAPQPRILSPNPEGGDDFAATVLGNPWEFDDGGDVIGTANIANGRTAGGAFHGTNSGPVQDNPYVILPHGPGVDPDRHHLLTIETTYDGPFSLGFGPGGGMHGRWLFQRADTGAQWHDSRELVTYPSRARVTYDLKDGRFGQTTEPGFRSWTGVPVTGLRWDPNEDPGQRSWRVHEIRLAAPHEANGVFEVEWEDAAHTDGTTVDIGVSSRRGAFDGATLRTGLAQRAGSDRATVDVSSLTPGSYWVWVRATAPNGVVSRTTASGELVVSGRIAGADRIATALALSRLGWPDRAAGVVVASAQAFPDALAGVQLADAVDGPLLLTGTAGLDPRVAAELQRLRPDEVHVLGGPSALSRGVETAIGEAAGDATVTRVAGADRYATAARIADAAVARWEADGVDVADRVLLAAGGTFPDALAAGQLVAATRTPLLLTGTTLLPDATAAGLKNRPDAAVTIVGGPAAVSHEVADAIGRPSERIAGVNRYETARKLATAAAAAGATADRTLVALGENFPDALAAGAFVARTGQTLVLTAGGALPAPTRAWLDQDTVRRATVVGGRAAVADHVVTSIHAAGRG